MAKNLNSRKVKRPLNGNRPKTAVPKSRQKKFRSKWNLRRQVCKSPVYVSGSENSFNAFYDQTVINNWLYGRSMYDMSPPHLMRPGILDQDVSMASFHDLLRNRLLQNRFIKDHAGMDRIMNSLAVNSLATREFLHDALKFGERHGVVQRVDYGPGEYCWVFTPPSNVFQSTQRPRCRCIRRLSHTDIHTSDNEDDYGLSATMPVQTHEPPDICNNSCLSLLEDKKGKVRFLIDNRKKNSANSETNEKKDY